MKAAETNITNETAIVNEDAVAFHDFKNSLLVVSLLANVFVFTAWLTIQVTDRYNAAIVNFLFS
jgi:hypothetical protein